MLPPPLRDLPHLLLVHETLLAPQRPLQLREIKRRGWLLPPDLGDDVLERPGRSGKGEEGVGDAVDAVVDREGGGSAGGTGPGGFEGGRGGEAGEVEPFDVAGV